MLEVDKHFQSICETGDYWDKSLNEYLLNNLKLTPIFVYTVSQVKNNNNEIAVWKADKTLSPFILIAQKVRHFWLFEALVCIGMSESISFFQKYYHQYLIKLSKSLQFTKSKCYRVLLSYSVYLRPDLTLIPNQFTELAKNVLSISKIKTLIALIKATLIATITFLKYYWF